MSANDTAISYEMSCADERSPPSSEYLLLDAESAEEERVHAERRDPEDEQQPDVDVGDVPVEVVAEPVVGAERDHRVGEQRRTTREAGPDEVQDLVARRRVRRSP